MKRDNCKSSKHNRDPQRPTSDICIPLVFQKAFNAPSVSILPLTFNQSLYGSGNYEKGWCVQKRYMDKIVKQGL